jgi:peptide deformylase
MIHPIVFEPAPMLHARSADVDPATIPSREMQKFIKDMVETMYVKDGVGLAAVQIGRPIQLCTIIKQYNDLNHFEDLCLINPTWTKLSKHYTTEEEGCLSVPNMYGKIKRYTNIRVQALDKNGKQLDFEANGFFARIIQHECDHLAGHLYIENATDLHRVEQTLY